MNFADRMRQLGALIVAQAPHLQAVENVANEGMSVLAAAVPSTAAAVAAIQAVEHVGNQVADLVVQTTTTTTVPAPPVPTVAPTPIAQDVASLAADAIGQTESTSHAQVVSRLQSIETAMVEIMPLLAQLAGKFNL